MSAMQVLSMQAESEPATRKGLREIVEHASRLLPEQAPLHAFVHHNTLHAFEALPFEDAVMKAGRVLSAEPFLAERALREYLAAGRMTDEDLAWVLADCTAGGAEQVFPAGPTRLAFRTQRLKYLFDIPRGRALVFVLQEGEALRALHPLVSPSRRQELAQSTRVGVEGPAADAALPKALGELWRLFKNAAPPLAPKTARGLRPRDVVLRMTGVDIDDWVHPLLIRLCSAFLDQGVAYWKMPRKNEGFLVAVRSLYALPGGAPERAFRGMSETFAQQQAARTSAEETIRWGLSVLEIADERLDPFIEESLLSLPGWAGMMRQLELSPERAPVAAPRASLLEYLAVKMVLEICAAQNALSDHAGRSALLSEVMRADTEGNDVRSFAEPDRSLAYEGFVLAQCLDVPWAALKGPGVARAWLNEVCVFDELLRRRVLHLAFERRQRVQVLDGIVNHNRGRSHRADRPKVQAIFCIDDREESTRRHLEEAYPDVETLAYPGFFGVAMAFRAAQAHKARALCPVVITPHNWVAEDWVGPSNHRRFKELRLSYHVGRMTLLRGFLTSILGAVALVPFILATVFRGRLGASVGTTKHRGPTRLRLRANEAGGVSEHSGRRVSQGFTPVEMADIVAALLVQTGIQARGLAPLVLLVGHGSSSVNNPHLAAYGCGATAGGCGGPNARAFASMANDPEVRALLVERGLTISQDVHFVGGMHDTCKDTVEFYDLELLEAEHAQSFRSFEQALQVALEKNARERVRLFGTVPLGKSPRAARREVQTRAVDFSEARPEYNHAKNSLCVVGPRHFTQDLFLDQRAFLVSYDASLDDSEGTILAAVLAGSLGVCAGINLEYFFSTVDPIRYGAGSKLPHNIVGLIGVMDGHASDLRTGLYQQMVELHEPVRLSTVIVAPVRVVLEVLRRDSRFAQLVDNGWIFLSVLDPETRELFEVKNGDAQPYVPTTDQLPVAANSLSRCEDRRSAILPARLARPGSLI